MRGFHYLHEFLDLLRSQHRCRLVENKYLVFAVEHFEYFGALLHTDGHILDDRIWIDAQSVLIAQLNYLFARLILFKKARLTCRLIAEDDVIENREALNKLEVLVHHSDTEAVGIVGVFYLDLFAVFLMTPSSAWYRPNKTLIKVLLPAPFSPSRACISPF